MAPTREGARGISAIAETLRQDLVRMFSLWAHVDEQELVAIWFYAVHGREPTTEEIDRKLTAMRIQEPTS